LGKNREGRISLPSPEYGEGSASRVDVKIQPKPEQGEGLRGGLFVARDGKWRKQRLRGRFPLRNYARVLD